MKKVLLLLACVLLVSCQKTKISDLQYKDKHKELYVYQNGVPFDGEAWSEDGNSIKFIVDCGVWQKGEYYTQDGWLFSSVSEKEELYFNEKGNEISKNTARELYRDEYDRMKRIIRECFDIIEEHPYQL